MLRNFVLKAGVEQSIGGVINFVNLLASSEGYVTLRAKNKQGGIELLSKLLNGDSFEFPNEVTEITIETPKDAVVSIFASHVKLVNNGVTVKPAGAIKTSTLLVSGKKKLNSISAQNQQIKIKSISGNVELLSEIGAGWPLATGEKEEINTSGDVYAYKAPLVVQMETVREAVFTETLTSAQNAPVYGENKDFYLLRRTADFAKVINGTPTALTGSVGAFADGEAFSLAFSGASAEPSVCFSAGEWLFLWVRRSLAGNTVLFVAKTSDLSNFEVVTAAVIGQQIVGGGENFGNGYLLADKTGAYLGYESTASGAGGSGSNFVAFINLTSGAVITQNVVTSYGAFNWIAGEEKFYLITAASLRTLDKNGYQLVTALTGLDFVQKGLTGFLWNGYAIFKYTNGVYKLNVTDGTHSTLPSITSANYNMVPIGDDFYTVESKNFVRFNLLTNIKTSRAFTYFTVAQGANGGALMTDGTEALVTFTINGVKQSGDAQGTQVFFNPLLIQSGEVKAAKLAVMELY